MKGFQGLGRLTFGDGVGLPTSEILVLVRAPLAVKSPMELLAEPFRDIGTVVLILPLKWLVGRFNPKGMGLQPQLRIYLVPRSPLQLPEFAKVLIIELPVCP